MTDEFDAKMQGRVGRGYLAEIKFFKRTLRWHVQEVRFHWSGSTRYVTELAVLLELTDTRAVIKTRTAGTKETDGGARDVLEPLETFQAAIFPPAVGLIGSSRTDLIASMRLLESLRSSTGCECCVRPSSWWPTANSNGSIRRRDVPVKSMVYGESDWTGLDSQRSTTGDFEQFVQHPIELSCSAQHGVALSIGEAEP